MRVMPPGYRACSKLFDGSGQCHSMRGCCPDSPSLTRRSANLTGIRAGVVGETAKTATSARVIGTCAPVDHSTVRMLGTCVSTHSTGTHAQLRLVVDGHVCVHLSNLRYQKLQVCTATRKHYGGTGACQGDCFRRMGLRTLSYVRSKFRAIFTQWVVLGSAHARCNHDLNSGKHATFGRTS